MRLHKFYCRILQRKNIEEHCDDNAGLFTALNLRPKQNSKCSEHDLFYIFFYQIWYNFDFINNKKLAYWDWDLKLGLFFDWIIQLHVILF
jgi:hypothetical protein